jgi:hypothetical protein
MSWKFEHQGIPFPCVQAITASPNSQVVHDRWGKTMKALSALLLAGLCSTSAIACDKVDAAKVQFTLSEMGTVWSEQDGRVKLDWAWEWDGAAPRQRLALLQAFAEGDVCLTGQTREISFYRKGKLVARASPTSGIQLLNDSATAQTAARVPPVQSVAACP